MPDLEIGPVDGGKLNFILSCSLVGRQKYRGKVLLDLTLYAKY